MSPPNRTLPMYARPLLKLAVCDALQRLIADEMLHPRFPELHELLVQGLGAITDTAARVREGKATKEETI